MASNAGPSSDDEEPDYMSDDFLKKCVQTDIRPSLIHSRAEKRAHEVVVRQQELNKTKAELEKKRVKSVEDALKVPIGEDNKGFQMLQKMGYKPGSSIGKETDVGKGIKEPIKVNLKRGRGGLGQEQHELDKQAKIISQMDPEEFRLRKQAAAKAREIFNDLRKAQFACMSLDEEMGIEKPLIAWYWPVVKKQAEGLAVDDSESASLTEGLAIPKFPRKKSKLELEDSSDSESEEEDEMPDDTKLTTLMEHLRSSYFYCIWCGVKYENSSEFENSCPGKEKDDH